MSEEEDRKRFAIDGREPQEVVFPTTVEQVIEVLRGADARHLAVAPVGHGAFLHLGGPPKRYDLALSSQRLDRIVDYQPMDMTVTVEAGMTLARLQETLGEHGQWLPLDPPLPKQATIGGIIATNLSGPVRVSQGTVRDFLLGLTVVRADGTVIKGGGRVVKNVAGYDLPKLYCGSFGTLGVIVEATFKVRPRPQAYRVLSCVFPAVAPAMELTLRLLGSELQPFFLELANFDPMAKAGQGSYAPGSHLFVGFAGLTEEVAYQSTRFRDFVPHDSIAIVEWEEEPGRELLCLLRDFPIAGEAVLRCKANMLPTQIAPFCHEVEEEAALLGVSLQLLTHAGNGIVYSRFLASEHLAPEKLCSLVDRLRMIAKKLGGSVVVEEVSPTLKERIDVWGHVGGAFPLMKKLKDMLDPQHLLNPGRFVGGI